MKKLLFLIVALLTAVLANAQDVKERLGERVELPGKLCISIQKSVETDSDHVKEMEQRRIQSSFIYKDGMKKEDLKDRIPEQSVDRIFHQIQQKAKIEKERLERFDEIAPYICFNAQFDGIETIHLDRQNRKIRVEEVNNLDWEDVYELDQIQSDEAIMQYYHQYNAGQLVIVKDEKKWWTEYSSGYQSEGIKSDYDHHLEDILTMLGQWDPQDYQGMDLSYEFIEEDRVIKFEASKGDVKVTGQLSKEAGWNLNTVSSFLNGELVKEASYENWSQVENGGSVPGQVVRVDYKNGSIIRVETLRISVLPWPEDERSLWRMPEDFDPMMPLPESTEAQGDADAP